MRRQLIFRHFLRSQTLLGASKVLPALQSMRIFKEAFADVDGAYEAQCDQWRLGGAPVIDFFEWLFENATEILAFVLKIIDLFTALTPTPAT